MIRQHFNHPITKRFIDAFPKFEADQDEDVKYFYETWQDSPFYISTLTKDDIKGFFKADNNVKVLADIKGLLNRKEYEEEFSYWRL